MNRKPRLSSLAVATAAFVSMFCNAVPALALSTTASSIPKTGDFIMRYLPWIIALILIAIAIIVIALVMRRRNKNSDASKGNHSK